MGNMNCNILHAYEREKKTLYPFFITKSMEKRDGSTQSALELSSRFNILVTESKKKENSTLILGIGFVCFLSFRGINFDLFNVHKNI